jgi:hypothetical protein
MKTTAFPATPLAPHSKSRFDVFVRLSIPVGRPKRIHELLSWPGKVN